MHQECIIFFDAVAHTKNTFFTGVIVLAEVYWVLSKLYKLPREQVVLLLKSIGRIKPLSYTEAYTFIIALSLIERYNVKFIDCLIASHKNLQNGSWAIVSYDTDFDVLGIKRVKPKEAVV